jgi:hypothetical protein
MTSDRQIDNIMGDLERLSEINAVLRKNMNELIQQKIHLNKQLSLWRLFAAGVAYMVVAATFTYVLLGG